MLIGGAAPAGAPTPQKETTSTLCPAECIHARGMQQYCCFANKLNFLKSGTQSMLVRIVRIVPISQLFAGRFVFRGPAKAPPAAAKKSI